MEALKNNYENIQDQWAAGIFNSDDPSITHTANISAVSQLRAIEQLLDLEYENLIAMLEK